MDPEEAQRRADELCAAERQRNARGRRVPFFIRGADSKQLNRQREWELFRQARSNVFSAPASSVAIVLAPFALGTLFVLFAHHPISVAYGLAWIVALATPFWLVVFHMRRELAKLASAEKRGESSMRS
jgi:hypothetical protein